jgi:hypothetical protein
MEVLRAWCKSLKYWGTRVRYSPHQVGPQRSGLILEPVDIQSEHITNEIYSDLSFISKFCTELSVCTLMFQLPIIAIIKVPQYYISQAPYCHILLNQIAALVFSSFSFMFLELTIETNYLLGIYIINVVHIPCSCLPHSYLDTYSLCAAESFLRN